MLAALSRFDRRPLLLRSRLAEGPGASRRAHQSRKRPCETRPARGSARLLRELLNGAPGRRQLPLSKPRARAQKDLGPLRGSAGQLRTGPLTIDPIPFAAFDHPRKRPGQACPLRGGFGELRSAPRRSIRADVDALNNRGFALTQKLRASATHSRAFDRAPRDRTRANIGVLDNRGAALLAIRPLRGRGRDLRPARLRSSPDDAEPSYHPPHALRQPRTVRGRRVSGLGTGVGDRPGPPRMHWARLAFLSLNALRLGKAEEFEAKPSNRGACGRRGGGSSRSRCFAYSIGPRISCANTRAVRAPSA